MSKAIQEIVADLRKADMSGAQVDAGHVADQIALAIVELEGKWRQRVKDALSVADLYKYALDYVLNTPRFSRSRRRERLMKTLSDIVAQMRGRGEVATRLERCAFRQQKGAGNDK